MADVKCGDSTENGDSLSGKSSAEMNPESQTEGMGKGKPKKFKPFAIALASVFVVLIGTVLVGKLCFNRDFMELIQGKTRYAQNVELATAKASAGQLVAGLDKSVGLFKSASEKKTLNADFQFDIKVEDQFLKDTNLSAEEAASIQQTVKYLNSLKINVKTLTGDKGTQSSFVLTDPSALKLTVDSLVYNDGKTYVHIPEILEKYLSAGDQATSQVNPYNLSKIKYDPQKLQASLEKLAAVYSDSLSAAAVKAENDQSVTIDGVTVRGQRLTASLTEAQTSAMVKAIAQTAKDDEVLYAFVSDNYSLFSAIAGSPSQTSSEKLTKEEYGKLIDEFLSKLNLETSGATFSAVSYLSQNGTLLAHCYEGGTKTDKGQLNYLLSDKKYAVEFLANQKKGFTFSNEKTGEGAGKLQLKIKSDQEPKNIGANVDYSGCKTVSFLDSDTTVGKYVISLYDPDHEVNDYVKQAGLPEAFNQLGQSSLTVETVPDGNNLGSAFRLSVPGVLSVSATGKMNGSSGAASMQAEPEPGQVLDLSKDESGEGMNELSMGGVGFLSKTLEKDPELAAVLSGFGISKEQLDMLAAYAQG